MQILQTIRQNGSQLSSGKDSSRKNAGKQRRFQGVDVFGAPFAFSKWQTQRRVNSALYENLNREVDMTKFDYFAQDCPTCGRQLRIDTQLHRTSVSCPHCRGEFVANDAKLLPEPPADWQSELLRRVDQLLAIDVDQLAA